MTRFSFALISTLGFLLTSPSYADEPEIIDARAKKAGMFWEISVTLRHPDTGWDHYADSWAVMDASGKKLATRKLHHPHVDEQPFTRSLNNVMIPDGTTEIFVSAKCSKGGWGSKKHRIKVAN